MTDVRTYLSRLDKPLQYATRNDFANLPKLRDLESFVQHQIQALQSRPLPASMPALLTQLAETVRGFDDLPLAEKRQRVQQAVQILSRLHDLSAGADDLSTPAPCRSNRLPRLRRRLPPIPLSQPVQYMRGVGPRRAALLAKLSLHTVGDLMWCLPVRYEDRRNLIPLGMLQVGARQTFCGTVTAFQLHHTSRGRSFATLRLEDASAPLACKWFQHRGLALQERFPIGARVVGNGVITFNRYDGSREAVHPDLEVLEAGRCRVDSLRPPGADLSPHRRADPEEHAEPDAQHRGELHAAAPGDAAGIGPQPPPAARIGTGHARRALPRRQRRPCGPR